MRTAFRTTASIPAGGSSRWNRLGGCEFGEVGAYEKIRGRLFYAVDPGDPANRPVVDLAPRGAEGRVRFSGDFLLLEPVGLHRGTGREIR